MSNLHAYFALRNQQGFAKALDGSRSQANNQATGSALSSSGGKSWTRTSVVSSAHGIDVNARDWLGRTVLHIACGVTEPYALAYVRLLLAHPNINVNLQDTESRWSALHRAFYAGNLAACMLLLQRAETDSQLKDYDGYTPFDLYNSTVDETKPDGYTARPSCDSPSDFVADLFTWGANRNAALGHGDAEDRTYPDQVIIQRPELLDVASPARFIPVKVKGISMAKLHTTVITDEKRGNLRACGFGSGGRLGPGQHTQYSLLPVPQLTHHVVAVALGQDHSLALTSDGEVLSWGLNRFAQLGYVVDQPTPSGPLHMRSMEEPIQAVARKILGPLKKETVVGVAACKTASACWTRTDVFTWGTNNGQLGYDKAAQPVQILPRKVTGVQVVTDLAMSDSAMVCLLGTMDVICFRDDTHFRVKFPPSDISDFPPYQHPYNVKPPIAKITSCDSLFAALSSRGDVFTFSVPPIPAEGASGKNDRGTVKPQKVWSLRKSFDPAKDIALGLDGEIILCTESGHVFVRSRHVKGGAGGKSLKFHRVPFIHRAVKVCANSTGAFAALRLNYTPKTIPVTGPSLTDDLREVRPWMSFGTPSPLEHVVGSLEDDEEGGGALETDVATTLQLCALLMAEKQSQKHEGHGLFRGMAGLAYGADIFVQAGLDIPAHRVILAARSSILRGIIEGSSPIVRDGSITVKYHSKGAGLPRLTVTGCHSMSVLVMLDYLYADDVPALWDRRVGVPCSERLARLKATPGQVKTELEALARILQLPALSDALAASVKRIPASTLNRDLERLFRGAADPTSSAVRPDIVLELADRNVACHSVVLRARSPFFQSFFDDEDWTVNRWASGGILEVDMKHLEWRAVDYVMSWMCQGKELELFDHLGSVETIQDLLELIFSVMAVASELLLDKLMLICSTVILRHVTLNNVHSLLAKATYYNALQLIDSLHAYVASNMEAILESRLLDGMQHDLVKDLSSFVRERQVTKYPVTRSNSITEKALRNAADWLELQDIPQPLVRTQRPVRESPRLAPVGLDKAFLPRQPSGPITSPLASPPLVSTTKLSPKTPHGDDIFSMEDESADAIPTLNIGQPRTPPTGYSVPTPAWKSKSAQPSTKADMKAIMAEAETTKPPTAASNIVSKTRVVGFDAMEQTGAGASKWSQKPSQRERRILQSQTTGPSYEPTRQAASPGSPWRLPAQEVSTSSNPVSLPVRGPQTTPSSSATTRMNDSLQSPISSLGASAAQVSRPQLATPASVLRASNPSLGPVVSPADPGSLLPGNLRRTSSDAPAWMPAPAELSIPPTVSGLSFVAIQQQQQDQGHQPKGKRSLREIQDEERARQEEQDFLTWWAAEEERLKAEAEADLSQVLNVDAGAPSKRGRDNRRGGRGGRGRRGDGRGRNGSTVPH